MSSYNRDTKSYESYEMLSKLLNSNKKENIDAVYDTLKKLTEQNYEGSLSQNESDYAKARDTLSRNRAKAEKYLDYFVNEGGYANSGVGTDARLKQELNYENNVSALNSEQVAAKEKLAREKQAEILRIESERASAQAEADTELADMALKNEQLELQKKQVEQDNYWKSKQYELQKNAYSGSSSSSSSSSGGGASHGDSAYSAVMYNEMIKKLSECKNADQMQELYDSIVGENTAAAQGIYGSFYSKLLSEMRETLLDKRAEEDNDDKVREICRLMTKVGYNSNNVFINLYRDSMLTSHPQYTTEQVEEAYRRVIRLWG